MSRWLSSVNSLLENLDGQAGTVAETVAEQATPNMISSNLRRLNDTIANNASALTSNITNANMYDSSGSNVGSTDDEDYDDDLEEEDSAFFDSDDFGYDEEFTTDDDNYETDGVDNNSADADENTDTIAKPNQTATGISTSATTKSDANDESAAMDDVNNAGQPQPNNVRPTASVAATENSETKEEEKALQTPASTNETPSANNNNKDIIPTNQQTSPPQKTVQQQNPKIQSLEAQEDKKNLPSGSGANDEPESTGKNSSSATAAVNINGEVGSSGQPGALPPQKPSNDKDESGSSKLVQDAKPRGKNLESSNKNIAAVSNQPPPPAQQQKVSPKPKSVAPTSVTNSNDAKSQSEKKKLQELMQKQKQQHDEIKSLKKQQQQVLASKNKKMQSLESQLVKLGEEVSKGAAEREKLNRRTKDLDEKLRSSEQEIEAQAQELQKAGEEMEQIRTDAKEEREDLLDDQEDEIEDAKRNHQEEFDKMRKEYEKTIAEWKERYEFEESLRQQEGGDSIRELQDANKREREALKKLAQVTEERTALQIKLDQVVGHEITLEEQVKSSLESAETVAAREQRARDELDESAAAHTKQMAQRQRREAELEQTILEMGSALTLAQQQLQHQNASSPKGKSTNLPGDSSQLQIDGAYYKEQFEQVAEELETIKDEFTMETQRRGALQQELTEVSKERKEELSLAQLQQNQHDLKVAELESTIRRYQASSRTSQQQSGQTGNDDDSSNAQATDTVHQVLSNQELEGAKKEIANLSEQLFRQQVLAKNAKSESLALKGRLQAANARAEDAEKAQYDTPRKTTQPRSRAYDIEGGGTDTTTTPSFSARRRVKGGSSRSVKSIRSALPCFPRGSADGGGVGQVALTIDAIDSWMVETGSFMRHEPYARLGLLLYLVILHLWSFALVAFHTTEVEHGDFGAMDSNPRHWREHT